MKNIIITGASQGIGRGLALKYAKNGCNLLLLARNQQALKELTNEINHNGIANEQIIKYFVCDVSNYDDCKRSIEYANDLFKHIDIAILNAGVSGSESFESFNSDNFKKIFDINLFGVAHFLEFLIPLMLSRGEGTIVGVSSLADSRGIPNSAAYCSSKIALSHLLEAARAALINKNINVITVRPGFVKTNMTAKNNFKMPFLMDLEPAVDIIYDGIESNKRRISFPFIPALASSIGGMVPGFLFDLVAKYIKYFDEQK